MNKNKKVIKFQRKEMLISNPLASQDQPHKDTQFTSKQSIQPLPSQQSNPTNSQFSAYVQNIPQLPDKLQIPKQMRIENIALNLKNKFIAMMEGQPAIKVDQLFENSVVCQITGNVPKNNRDSFGKNDLPKQESETIENNPHHAFFQFSEQEYRRPFPQQMIKQNHQMAYEPNYLDFVPQEQIRNHTPFEQLFESQERFNAWPHQRNHNGVFSEHNQFFIQESINESNENYDRLNFS